LVSKCNYFIGNINSIYAGDENHITNVRIFFIKCAVVGPFRIKLWPKYKEKLFKFYGVYVNAFIDRRQVNDLLCTYTKHMNRLMTSKIFLPVLLYNIWFKYQKNSRVPCITYNYSVYFSRDKIDIKRQIKISLLCLM
jgi:hypothetical protein